MIIKYSKDEVLMNIVGFGATTTICVLLCHYMKEVLFYWLGVMFLGWIIGIINAISLTRTFILDEEGITVSFLKFSCKYAWDEFKTKRVIKRDAGYHKETVMICKKEQKHLFIEPIIYSRWFHPWSIIVIHLDMPSKMGSSYGYEQLYLADREVFYTKMNQWGIILEEQEILNAKSIYKKRMVTKCIILGIIITVLFAVVLLMGRL